ncbi:MAG: carboxylesterase [Confluentimicrobium sp.]|jgi:hypothetical protein|uniref:holin family protein n=1 Tax=Actibacterium sp. TaxID=1872125 RepID=UPI000C44DA99|nr:holin family protein [Actibacterium sp.]MBC57526.1 carboxylesterase [Actibacterium sp.]|tara:strand:+ start:76 stop:612 length:537 start_codon:yes stop_codon:yes gene_type:complete
MGLIDGMFTLLFGNGRNVLRDTAQVFRENAEAGAGRDLARSDAALAQFTAEFARAERGLFDRIIDGLNRLPRPALALGTIALLVSAMVDPIWFATRMQGIALVPEPLWWLLGAIISFYFGARHQTKGQEFQRSIAETVARAPQVAQNISGLELLRAGPAPAAVAAAPNAALEDWRRGR